MINDLFNSQIVKMMFFREQLSNDRAGIILDAVTENVSSAKSQRSIASTSPVRRSSSCALSVSSV
jgi:hypothetical protein